MYMNDGNKTKINLRNKSVFITGVAGFIGSNLAKRLLSTVEGVKVVGLDNMNHYYDVRLKEARLNELEQFDNFSFVKGNLADKAVIESIFEQYKPEIVVNLGAQAGVRYSITNPDAYVEANLIGFYNILEACRHSYDEGHTPVEHLVYASSSSVYGSNKKVPYSTDDKVDNPVSLYAATKKSNELMAHAYSKLYNIPSTGLRFFTVYGPAGRPDMAYFGFTNKLLKGETIQIFNYGNCKRDFTYVDDIVEGVVRVMQGAPERKNGEDGLPVPPYAVYNIGNQNPENLLDFVQILQEELIRAGVLPEDYDFEAHKKLVPMQPGDVPVTYADTSALERDFGYALKGTCGIGHTRWATHGEPSQTNAHPHVSGNCSRSGSGTVESEVVGVHNGIIENYTELKEKLLKHGYTFYSQTDTEVVIKLVDYYYKKYNLGPIDAIAKTMVRVRGSYALELMFRDYPGEIWVARKDSPMIIGIADGETYVASDVPAILKYTRNVYYIGNLEFAKLTPGEAHFYDLNGDEIEKQTTEIKWDAEAAEKGGFEHFMMKEIHEQPKAVQDTLNSVIKNGAIDLSGVEITEDEIKNFEQIYIVACGSAWHVGMAAQYVLEDMADIPVRVELASEFRYRKMPLNRKALVIVVSQSGETADTLAALRLAKEKGITTMAVVNVVGSSIAREADKVFYTLAGPEISVATTKAYSAQLAAMYCLAVQFAKVREKITEEQYSYYISELLTLPEKMQKTLEDKERIQWFAAKYANAHDVFFVGRGIDYAVCLEGSLKLKEISYIHSEAYAAGELKHGTISLIERGTLVIGVLTQSELYEKTISNMLECKSRGAYLMGLTTYGKYEIEDQVNFTVYVPKVDEHFVGSLAVIPLQLLGYYVSVAKGLDVDKPRNLAKSVTVE